MTSGTLTFWGMSGQVIMPAPSTTTAATATIHHGNYALEAQQAPAFSLRKKPKDLR